jgi:hypothetical protein
LLRIFVLWDTTKEEGVSWELNEKGVAGVGRRLVSEREGKIETIT